MLGPGSAHLMQQGWRLAPLAVVGCVAGLVGAHAQRQAALSLVRADQRQRVAAVLPIAVLCSTKDGRSDAMAATPKHLPSAIQQMMHVGLESQQTSARRRRGPCRLSEKVLATVLSSTVMPTVRNSALYDDIDASHTSAGDLVGLICMPSSNGPP